MANKLIWTLLVGPNGMVLTGERRRAFFRNWAISVAIGAFVIIAMTIDAAATKTVFPGQSEHVILGIGICAIVAQGVVMIARHETIWQLKIRERAISRQTVADSKQDLLDFAAQMQNKDEGSNQ